MKNDQLKEFLKDVRRILSRLCYSILKQLVVLAVVGTMVILFYEAGRADMFNMQSNVDEICEQHEKDLSMSNDDYAIEQTKKDKGDVYEE
jgi:DNA topoisomerase VI subunit A